MPRKTELQEEEAAVNSPLRRSSRRNVTINSPAPATLTSRRNSQSQAETTETKAPKTRRVSLSQENTEKDAINESKPAPRGRRASSSKEDVEQKTEPAKTRSRRSSAATEPPAQEAEKKQIVTRRRKSSAAEDPEPESVKPIKGRRSSVADKLAEEDSVKKPIRGRRSSVKEEEAKEEVTKKNLRRRKSSATDEILEADPKERKPTKGRRASTDKFDDEPETKSVKLTPIKSKRRTSVTENAIILDPIEEQEAETKGRKSASPPKSDFKEAVVSLTPVKMNKAANLDLSTINESSFTEESLNKSTSEKKLTPRKSPRLNKETNITISKDSLTSGKSTPDKEIKADRLTSESPKRTQETDENIEKMTEQNKVDTNKENSENNTEEPVNIGIIDDSLEKNESPIRKKLQFGPETTQEIKSEGLGQEVNEMDLKEDSLNLKNSRMLEEERENVQTEALIQDHESIKKSVDESDFKQRELSNEQNETEKVNTECADIIMGSDGSFKLNLNISLTSTNSKNISQDDVHDDLNTSKNSSGSDKENIEISSPKDPSLCKVNLVGDKQKILGNIIDTNADDNYREMKVQQDIVTARVSNVFQPKMEENSFVEPMDVDEFPSILETTQNKTSFELEDSSVKNVPPAISTPIVKRSIKGFENKENHKSEEEIENTDHENVCKQSIDVAENDSEDGSIKLCLSDSQINQEEDESKEKYDVSEDVTIDPEYTEESEIEVCKTTCKQDETSEEVSSPSILEDTTKVEDLQVMKETNMCTPNITSDIENLDQSTKSFENAARTENENHGKTPESLSPEIEIGKEQSIKLKESESSHDEIIGKLKEGIQVKSPQLQLESKEKRRDVEIGDEVARSARKSRSPQPISMKTEKIESKEKYSLLEKSVEEMHDETEHEFKRSLGKSKSLQPQYMKIEVKSEKKESLIEESKEKIHDIDTEHEGEKKSSRNSKSPDVEVQDEKTSSLRKFTSHQTKIIDELERKIGKSSKLKSPLAETHVELKQEQKLMKSLSHEPHHTNDDELKIEVGSKLLRKSNNSPGDSQNSELQHEKSDLSRKSNSPRPQIINIDELESENKEVLRKSKSPQPYFYDNTEMFQEKEENQAVELVQDESHSPKPRSPQHEEEIVTKKKSFSIQSSGTVLHIQLKQLSEISKYVSHGKLGDIKSKSEPQAVNHSTVELNQKSKSPLPEEENSNSPTNEDALLESPESEISKKTDFSDDYEFDLPSDEEEIDKTENLELKDINSEYQSVIVEKMDESKISSTKESKTVALSIPLKRKSDHFEEEASKKMKITPILEETIQNLDSREAIVEEKLPVGLSALDEVNIIDEKIEKLSGDEMEEESVESATELLTDREDLSDSLNVHEGINKLESNKLSLVTQNKITEENLRDKSNINKKVHYQEEIQQKNEDNDIYVQNELEDDNISVVDSKYENYEKVCCDLTLKECTVEKDVAEIEGNKDSANSNIHVMDDTDIENQTGGVSENKTETDSNEIGQIMQIGEKEKSKKKSKKSKKSSKKRAQIDVTTEIVVKNVNVENTDDNVGSNDTVNKSVESGVTGDGAAKCNILDSDFEDVIQDYNDVVKAGKKDKKKLKKKQTHVDVAKEHLRIMRNEEENHDGEKPEEICHSKKSERKKKLSEGNNYNKSSREMRTKKKSKKSKKSHESDEGEFIDMENEEKRSKKSSVIENNKEEKESNNSLNIEEKHKNQKKPDEVTTSHNENPAKKSDRKTVDLVLNEDISPRKKSVDLEGLDAYAILRLNDYFTKQMEEMNSEDESYICTDDEDNDEEKNEFINSMAEEGEEDTPSEGSNDIIDEGESINSTESDIDSDDYDESDSFICNEEEGELLSGDEYDLGNEKKQEKEKKSRIIYQENCDDDIIRIGKKEKPVKKKRSRIITISDSSDSELDNKEESNENNSEDVLVVEKIVESPNRSTEETNDIEETGQIDDVIILEEKSTPVKTPDKQIRRLNVSTTESQKKKKSSVIIKENISVDEIKDAALSERITILVDNFCNTVRKGEVCMNLSLEHAIKESTYEYPVEDDDVFIDEDKKKKKDKVSKRYSRDRDTSEEIEEGMPSKKAQRLSVTLDNIEDQGKLKKKSSKRRRKSKSLDDLSVRKNKKKENSFDRMKKNVEKAKKIKSQKKSKSSQTRVSADDLHAQSYSLMNQLITDVKNRPLRTIKPSTTVIDVNGSWISEVADVKPSTTLVNRREIADYKAGKVHPKDFRSQMLYDSSRVKRVDTKTLLRKKGAYF